MNPFTPIRSRYAISNIVPSSSYSFLTFSGTSSVSGFTMATLTTGGTYSQGYIYAPYLIMTGITTTWYDPEYERRQIRKLRKKKIEEIWGGNQQ